MQRQRFTFLMRVISFDDYKTRKDRWQSDKFCPFREFFEAVNCSFLKLRKPSAHLAIDETLYPYRGRIGFKQYNPSKPAKYGLLFRSLCDSNVQYMYFCLPSIQAMHIIVFQCWVALDRPFFRSMLWGKVGICLKWDS